LYQKHKLIVMMTDSCCSYEGQQAPECRGASIMVGDEAAHWEVVQQLFFQAEGFVDANAAKPGTFAFFGDKGSYFTSAICKHMSSPTTRSAVNAACTVTWADFMGVVRAEIKEYVSEDIQSHVCYYLGDEPKRHYEKKLKLVNNSSHIIEVKLAVTYVDNNQWAQWNTGDQIYVLAPGETTYLRWSDTGLVRGAKVRISAISRCRQFTWNSGVITLVDQRWGFTAGDRMMTYSHGFGD
jgi:hypothetical protein